MSTPTPPPTPPTPPTPPPNGSAGGSPDSSSGPGEGTDSTRSDPTTNTAPGNSASQRAAQRDNASQGPQDSSQDPREASSPSRQGGQDPTSTVEGELNPGEGMDPSEAAGNPRPKPDGALQKAKEQAKNAPGVDDYNRRRDKGQGKDEAAVGAAAGEAAFQAGDKYLGGALSKAKASSKTANKVLTKAEDVVGDSVARKYKRAKWAAGVAFFLAIILLVPIIISNFTAIQVTTDPAELDDSCMAQYYGELPGEAPRVSSARLAKYQERTLSTIIQVSQDTSMGGNTAALAAMVAYAEIGLGKGSPTNRVGWGAFQQDEGWWVNEFAEGAEVKGGPNDPRLDVYKATRKFMWSFRTRMKANGEAGVMQEPVGEIESALNKLGVDTAGSKNWWAAWKKADLSETFADPANRDAVITVAAQVQRFQTNGLPSRISNTAAVRNYRNKVTAGANIWMPIIDRVSATKAQASSSQAEAVNTAAGFAADVKRAAGYDPDTAVELDIEGYAGEDTALPGVFVLGDSIAAGISDELEDAGLNVNAEEGRKASQDEWAPLKSLEAQASGTWVIALGTNNSSDPASLELVDNWINQVKKARNPAAPQVVYWVTPYRPPGAELGPADEFAQKIREYAASEKAKGTTKLSWFRVLDWADAVNNGTNKDKWYPDGIDVHPVGKGTDALSTLIMSVGAGSSAVSTDVFDGCTGGVVESFDVEDLTAQGAIKVISTKPEEVLFTVGPPPEDAEFWVPQTLDRAKQALVNAPCPVAGCLSLCGHLAGKIQGQSQSGKDSARLLWQSFEEQGLAVYPSAANGYAPPLGAMLFWDIGDSGHVATYVGPDQVVTNWGSSTKQDVVLMSASVMNAAYKPFYGWALPPTRWRPVKTAEESKEVRQKARATGVSLYYSF
jgi:hypothetical protein